METSIKDLTQEHTNKSFNVRGLVMKVVQTGGPTLFVVSDGTGTLALKGFDGAGVRAFPQVNEGDAIDALIKLQEYNGEIEGEIKKLHKLPPHERQKVHDMIESEFRKNARPTNTNFMASSPLLEKMKDRFIAAATEIRMAILKGRPIIVRHHNDCDGYSSGYTLERAIIPLIQQHHTDPKAAWEHFARAPCAAPFYEIEDSIKDISRALSNVAKFSETMPLIVIVDNGSGMEDLLGIQQGRVHGADFIVVDHHFFEQDVISSQVLVHINPFLVGEDGSTYSAGMLCTELAKFINPAVDHIDHIPAMAGFADRIKNPTVLEQYLKMAEAKGYSREMLYEIGGLIDYVSSKLRFMEAREYLRAVFGENMEKQKALLAIMTPHIRRLEANGLAVARSAFQKEHIHETTFAILLIEETFSRGTYPKPGRCVGLLHDSLQEIEKITNLVTIGLLTDAITIRATDGANFSVHDFIAYLKEILPESFPEGGGHKNAGSIKFIPSQQKHVLNALRSFIKKR